EGYLDRAVEAAGAQESRVEALRPVGGSHDHHARLLVEAVHLGQQLVEGLLALVVAAEDPDAAPGANGVDLIDEDDRRCPLPGIGEQVPNTGRPDADEHLDEARAS